MPEDSRGIGPPGRKRGPWPGPAPEDHQNSYTGAGNNRSCEILQAGAPLARICDVVLVDIEPIDLGSATTPVAMAHVTIGASLDLSLPIYRFGGRVWVEARPAGYPRLTAAQSAKIIASCDIIVVMLREVVPTLFAWNGDLFARQAPVIWPRRTP